MTERIFLTARAAKVDTDRRVIEATVIPYGETARVSDDGRTFYSETFEQGGATFADKVRLFNGHQVGPSGVQRGQVIGTATEWADDADGLRATFTIARTAEGNDVIELADVLGEVHVSAEYAVPRAYKAGEQVVRSAAEPIQIDNVAVILPPHRPAFAGAQGTARTETAMTDVPTIPDAPDAPEVPDEDELTGRAAVDEAVRRALSRMNVGGASTAARVRSPFDQFSSFGDLALAAREGSSADGAALSRQFHDAFHQWEDRRRAARVLVHQISPDNPGVMPPAWLTEVFGVIDIGRPGIDAMGGPKSAGSTGLELSWPYFDGDLSVLVAEQTAEKTDITSVLVSFKKGSADLATFSGGSNISLQLERRSSPSYVATYNRVMASAYGLTTEYRFENDLLAAATGSGPFDPLTANGAAWRAFLFGASSKVRTATGSAATAVLVSSDVFLHMGGLPDLMPPQYGTQNQSGTSSASELQISVSGLTITEAPGLPAGSVIVSNSSAASWVEDGPFLVTSLDAVKLGREVAIWGLGATAAFLPAGIVKSSAVTATTASRTK